MAKNIVQSLLTIFAEKMAGSSRADMDSAQRFLDGEIASYRDQLRAAEKRRADLAEKYPDIVRNRSPDAPGGDDNGNRLEQARATVAQLKLELADAVSKRDTIQKELASVPADANRRSGATISSSVAGFHRSRSGCRSFAVISIVCC